jgi:hypothetical protein
VVVEVVVVGAAANNICVFKFDAERFSHTDKLYQGHVRIKHW